MTASPIKRLYDAVAGHPALAPRLQRLVAPSRAAVLLYHGLVERPLPVSDGCFLEAADFRRQMEYLARRCLVIPLGDVLRPAGRGSSWRPRVALTFDDGFMSVRDLAFPVLSGLGLPATVFLTTSCVGTAGTVWFCHVHRAVIETGRRSVSWGGIELDLGDRRSRERSSTALQEEIKRLPPGEIPAALDSLAELLGVAPPGEAPPGSPWRMLDAASVREMADSGLVEFGAHAHHHVILAKLQGREREREIRSSLEATAALSGRACRTFAYPNGRAADFSAADVELLRRLGVTLATTTERIGAGPGSDPMRLGRHAVAAGLSFPAFVATVHNLRRPVFRRPAPH